MTTPSPYIEPPTIPTGMTVAEYRRARLPRNEPVALYLLPAGPPGGRGSAICACPRSSFMPSFAG
jgi:hypothetical protein